MADFLQLAKDAYASSTTYFDNNYRKKIEYGIRAFQNEHAPGSKYLSEDYKGRSKIFRPKTRAIIRKNEAAANIALFSNQDVLVVGSEDPSNPYAVAGSSLMKAVMQHRLTKSIPWFKVAMGALQDAQTVGACCSYNYWEYKKKSDGTKVKDEPCIKLRPLENIRIDGGADWMDPINTSPYLIDIVPMYVCDVKAMMETPDEKTGTKWKKYDESVIVKATPDAIDTTRRLRQGPNATDPYEEDHPITDHDIVWVFKVFMRQGSDDFCYYTLGNEQLLTDPKPIEEVYFHGKRPYTMGCFIIETHKAIPDGVAQVTKGLQQESNEITNQRIDNVKLVLNKRWFVARGRQVDVGSLTRNVPGGVTLMNDPNLDVKESNWPDVTSSAYVEQDRLNSDFDELAGNFSASTKVANSAVNDTLGGSRMANQAASVMTEYGLRTWIETWVEPTLRQLMLLEQYYETDETVLALCGKQAGLYPRFGVGLDQLLLQELTLTVNVGQGATDPQQRMAKFIGATQAAIGFAQTPIPGFNVQEAIKEVYSYAGFRDGTRFFSGQADPRIAHLGQMVQALQAEIKSKRYELELKAKTDFAIAQLSKQSKDAETVVNADRIAKDYSIRSLEVQNSNRETDVKLTGILMQAKDGEVAGEHRTRELVVRAAEADSRASIEQERVANERAKSEHERAMAEREAVQTESNENRIAEVTQKISTAFDGIVGQVAELKGELKEAQKSAEKVNQLQEAFLEVARATTALAQNVEAMGNKPKPKGYKKKVGADGKKTYVIVMDNDTEMEMAEQ